MFEYGMSSGMTFLAVWSSNIVLLNPNHVKCLWETFLVYSVRLEDPELELSKVSDRIFLWSVELRIASRHPCGSSCQSSTLPVSKSAVFRPRTTHSDHRAVLTSSTVIPVKALSCWSCQLLPWSASPLHIRSDQNWYARSRLEETLGTDCRSILCSVGVYTATTHVTRASPCKRAHMCRWLGGP